MDRLRAARFAIIAAYDVLRTVYLGLRGIEKSALNSLETLSATTTVKLRTAAALAKEAAGEDVKG